MIFKTNKKPQSAAREAMSMGAVHGSKKQGKATSGIADMLAAHTFRRHFVAAK